jgi:putative lipoprotein
MRSRNVLRIAFTMAIVVSVGRMKAQDSAAPAPPKSHLMPVMRKFSYACDHGATVVVYLRARNARILFKDKSYSMKQLEAASGTRYSDGQLVWWSKGHTGFLRDETNPNQPVPLAENCNQVFPAPATASPTVSGTVAYRERMAMPANALLTIQIQDISSADAPASIVAEQKITFAGHQVPLRFELQYDPAKIDPKHTYALSARITLGDQLMFLNTTAIRVITEGNPTKVDLVLQMVEGQSKPRK